MEHIITRRRGFRKLLAFLLCMASILGLLPAQAFAMSVGQTASSWLGDQYVGSDGNHYRAPAPYTYLAYHADGTIDVHTSSGGNAYRHYMLTDSDGISHQVYCVESGIPYHTSENTYVSESGSIIICLLVKVYSFPFLVTETPLPFKASRSIFKLLVSVTVRV
jgi:hypothetical protein